MFQSNLIDDNFDYSQCNINCFATRQIFLSFSNSDKNSLFSYREVQSCFHDLLECGDPIQETIFSQRQVHLHLSVFVKLSILHGINYSTSATPQNSGCIITAHNIIHLQGIMVMVAAKDPFNYLTNPITSFVNQLQIYGIRTCAGF